ncbi:MAG: hypothetical protein COV91_04320 [Candidatus Taylorbacteria bacterium CG11_big_fil_rev_8_21_14_0_20_46_11]|uniref:DUF5671 domain-containing protein n=1 Tax=Candidatus Taylorbacteria bacterium CG11_big_fil_rev_8_21_14_0_20_46_11 TaxID=1975025 RepID=A0A2H0KAV4_9BACT|nr:MAG: hypothetical protein COV91_04320 [Candidatus Taylorbacteria bacterium CG11_big_fil_rev_8_21_14_0_20_46_11]
MLFLFLVRKKYGKELVDERVISISGQASRMTYIISTLTLAILGLFLIFSGKGKNDIYTEALGTIFSYAAMFNIAVYAISFKFFNKKYGAN